MTVDFEQLAKTGMPAGELALSFLREYSKMKGKKLSFPINPFQMLKDLGILFNFRPFKNYDGVYIPASGENDSPVVGINLKRPITRQRFSAAHELCHHLKDANNAYTCEPNSKSEIETYAEDFAAELLMPSIKLKQKVDERAKNGYVNFDDVLYIADFFGVSFTACLYQVAYRLHKIKGNVSWKFLTKEINKYKPMNRRKELGMYDTVLYEQLFDAIGDCFKIIPNPHICQKFKSEYIYHDSRLEGIDIDQETAAAIVSDLRLYKQNSPYCKETNKNIIEVAGLTLAYDYVFEEVQNELSIYDAKHLNEKLFSTSEYPEYGGRYRETNTLVLGAKFETIDYRKIPEEMYFLDKDIKQLMEEYTNLSFSCFVEQVIRIHHRLTVIHAFRDGNGRTSRAFANMMLLKRDIPPVFFKNTEKEEYKDALGLVDKTNQFDALYERFFKSILNSYSTLTNFRV